MKFLAISQRIDYVWVVSFQLSMFQTKIFICFVTEIKPAIISREIQALIDFI